MQRKSVESFKFSPLSDELLEMAEQLQQLGGGPVAVGGFRVVGVVQDRSGSDKVLWPQPRGLSVRDPALSSSKPVDQSVKFYSMSECYAASNMPPASQLPAVADIVDWLQKGFSANLVAYGHRSNFKPAMLLGDDITPFSNSLLGEIGQRVLEYAAEPAQPLAVGLAALQLLGREEVDLFANTAESGKVSPVVVECQTAENLEKLVKHAQQQAARNQELQQQGVSHLFLKLYILNRLQNTLCHLQVIDLAGRPSGADHSPPHRDLALQFAAFSKMLQQLRESSCNATITAARESRLTELLFPMLTDNAATWVFAFLQDGEAHLSATQSTLQTLFGVDEIKVACRHISSTDSEFPTLRPLTEVLHVRDMPQLFPSTPPRVQAESPVLDLHALARSAVLSPADAAEQLSKWLTAERPKPNQFPNTDERAEPALVGAEKAGLALPYTRPSEPRQQAIAQQQGSMSQQTVQLAMQQQDGPSASARADESWQRPLASEKTPVLAGGELHTRPVPSPRKESPVSLDASDHSSDLAQVMGEFKSLMKSLTMDELKARVLSESPTSDQTQPPAHDQTRIEIDKLLQDFDSPRSEVDGVENRRVLVGRLHLDSQSTTEVSHADSSSKLRPLSNSEELDRMPPAWELSSQEHSAAYGGENVGHQQEQQPDLNEQHKHMSLDVLKSNYDTLLHALEEEQRRRVIATDKLVLQEQEFQEKETQYQLAIDTLKVNEVRLRSQLRKMASQHSLNSAFDEYEREITRLRAECNELKERNVVLELQLAETYSRPHDSNREPSQASNPVLKSAALLKSSLKKLQKENTELRHKLEEHKRHERQQQVSSRVAKGASQKVQQLSAQLVEVKDALQREQLATTKALAELQRARDALTSASHQEVILRNENAMMGERVVALQQKVHDYELEEKRRVAFENFSKKHTRGQDGASTKALNSSPVRRSAEIDKQRRPSRRDDAQHDDDDDYDDADEHPSNGAIPLDLMLQLTVPQTAEVLVALQNNVKRLAPGLMPLVTKLRNSLASERANLDPAGDTRNSTNFAVSSSSRIPPAVTASWHMHPT